MTFRNYKINIPKYVRSRAKKKTRDKYIKCLERRFLLSKVLCKRFFFFIYFLYLSMVSKVQNCQIYADSLEPRGDKLIVFREKS